MQMSQSSSTNHLVTSLNLILTRNKNKYNIRKHNLKKNSQRPINDAQEITSGAFRCAETSSNNTSDANDYLKIKQKVKEKIKTIITERKRENDSLKKSYRRNNSKSSCSMRYLESIYIDYINKQIKPEKQRRDPILLRQGRFKISLGKNQRYLQSIECCQDSKPVQRHSNSHTFLSKQVARIKKNRPMKINDSSILYSKGEKANIIQTQILKQKLSGSQLIRDPKRSQKSILKSARLNSPKSFLEQLKPWSNQMYDS